MYAVEKHKKERRGNDNNGELALPSIRLSWEENLWGQRDSLGVRASQILL